jgi:hypothetical protein
MEQSFLLTCEWELHKKGLAVSARIARMEPYVACVDRVLTVCGIWLPPRTIVPKL